MVVRQINWPGLFWETLILAQIEKHIHRNKINFMQRKKKGPSPIADATFCGSERWCFSWSKAPLPHDLRRPLLCIGRVDADNWENTNTSKRTTLKIESMHLSCRCCYYKVVNGDDAALHLLPLHQLHPLRCHHLPAISTLLRRIKTTALIVEEVPSSASSAMGASVTQIGGKMIAETSVLFVSVKKVFDTTTLETRHHWLHQRDPLLVKSIEISSVQSSMFLL